MSEIEPGACTLVTAERKPTAVVKAHVPLSKIPEAERAARAKLDVALPALDVGRYGDAFTLWHPPVDGLLYLEPGVVVARDFVPCGEVVPSALPAGRAAQLRLVASYEAIPAAWQTLFSWCAHEGLALAHVNWQIYARSDAAKPETLLHTLLA